MPLSGSKLWRCVAPGSPDSGKVINKSFRVTAEVSLADGETTGQVLNFLKGDSIFQGVQAVVTNCTHKFGNKGWKVCLDYVELDEQFSVLPTMKSEERMEKTKETLVV